MNRLRRTAQPGALILLLLLGNQKKEVYNKKEPFLYFIR